MEAFLSGQQPTLAPFRGLANSPPYLIEAPSRQDFGFRRSRLGSATPEPAEQVSMPLQQGVRLDNEDRLFPLVDSPR